MALLKSPFLSDFVTRCTQIDLPELPSHLAGFPRTWPFPRGDLYHWIGVLNRFDDILGSIIEKYELSSGPQTTPFGRSVLLDSFTNEADAPTAEQVDARLDALGYSPDGDRELIEAILDFSRLLQEKCGNRSLYSSSERLNDLLNTTSLSLLHTTLRLALTLAQRYHARHRTTTSTHLQQNLLAAYYNIDLERVQKLASPFPRPSMLAKPTITSSPATATKSKEKTVQTRHDANDMISLVRDNDGWEEWGHVRALYYPSGSSSQGRIQAEGGFGEQNHQAPSTPTPQRRSTTNPTPRPSRMSSTDESPSANANPSNGKSEEALRGAKALEIPYSKVSSTKAEDLLKSKLPEVPDESKYDFLHRTRVAQGLANSLGTREQLLAIRILSITNLAYVYPEPVFQQKILQCDSDQAKRLQLAYQLVELVHLGASGDIGASRATQTIALNTLDALAKHKARSSEVCAALNVNVNHGVLMFLTRRAINELAGPDNDGDDPDQDDWRDALFALLRTLPGSSSRTPETLVAAGLIPMFVDILNLRTDKARRVYPRVLDFLDSFVHVVRDALGTLAAAKGFDAISNLIAFEAQSSFENVKGGHGIPTVHKTPSVDYQLPYFQQQSLRWLFRFVNHIMQHNAGGFDRLLRNLIDSPPLLAALRLVIENAAIFGSHVWSGAVNILSSFIHNEPTSYAVIAEAGLSSSFLEAVMSRSLNVLVNSEPLIVESEPSSSSGAVIVTPGTSFRGEGKQSIYSLVRPGRKELARGILPATEAMSCIPQAFGAICLNTSGSELFQNSDALDSYFEIFESPEHVKCMKDDANLVRSLGTTFDELVRHHPRLKQSVMTAVIVMIARVGLLCRSKAWEHGAGTKLWTELSDEKLSVAGGASSLISDIGIPIESLPQDFRPFSVPEISEGSTLPNGSKLVVGDLKQLDLPENVPLDAKEEDSHGLTVANYLYPVLRFLGAFFENQSNCTYFIESGGIEFVLDFATLPSLPFNFHVSEANHELTQLIHMLAETKPHLVLPSLIKRTLTSVDCITDFWSEPKPEGFFTSLTTPPINSESKDGEADNANPARRSGTYFAKHLVAIHILTDALREVYTPPMYQTRPSQQTSPFNQVILADRYSSLINALGNLQAACVWEENTLQKNIPERWNKAIKPRDEISGDDVNDVLALFHVDERLNVTENEQGHSGISPQGNMTVGIDSTTDHEPKEAEDRAAFKNAQTLGYLLTSLPSSVTGFFHLLGHGLIGKRRIEPYQRQNASMAADAIASVVLRQLQLGAPNKSSCIKDRFSYLVVILSSFSQLLFESESPHCCMLYQKP